jgi:hypothetical protein
MAPGDEVMAMELLARTFREFISAPEILAPRTETFTLDGAAWYRVTPGQRTVLMAMAPAAVWNLNSQETGEQP